MSKAKSFYDPRRSWFAALAALAVIVLVGCACGGRPSSSDAHPP